jgi:signal peptidase
MKKVAFYGIIVLCLLCIVLTVMIYIAPRLGWYVNNVSSGSMEPAIPTGAMVVTCPVDPADIEVGDVILYRPSFSVDSLIVHRVIEIRGDSSFRFVTQGDANLNPDPYTIHVNNVVGRVCFDAAGFGRAIEFVRSTAGFFTLVVGPSIILLGAYIWSVWQVLNENSKKRSASDSPPE